MTSVATLGLIDESLTRGGIITCIAGVAAGAGALFAVDRYLSYEHEHLPFNCADQVAYRRGLMLLVATTLHNVPEGLAVGTGYAAQPRLGLLLAIAIALHNIPEGVAVAGPFKACGMPALRALGWAVLSGLAEPLAALVGAMFARLVGAMLPFSLASAAGARLYVVSDELIPESHSHGYEHQATFGFVLGFLVLLALTRIL